MREKKVIRCYFLLDYFRKFNPTRDIKHKYIRDELLDSDCYCEDPYMFRPRKVKEILANPELYNLKAYERAYSLIEQYKYFDKLANKSDKEVKNEKTDKK